MITFVIRHTLPTGEVAGYIREMNILGRNKGCAKVFEALSQEEVVKKVSEVKKLHETTWLKKHPVIGKPYSKWHQWKGFSLKEIVTEAEIL